MEMMEKQLVKILQINLPLTIPNPAPQEITVSFRAEQPTQANYLDSNVLNNGVGTVVIPEGQTEVNVDILDDDADEIEAKATITVTLNADPSVTALYSIDSNASIMFIATSDDGVNASITAKDGKLNFTEGEEAIVVFNISQQGNTPIPPEISIELKYTINEESEGESFLQSSFARTGTISFTSTDVTNNPSKDLTIPLVGNAIDQADGNISVTLEIGEKL